MRRDMREELRCRSSDPPACCWALWEAGDEADPVRRVPGLGVDLGRLYDRREGPEHLLRHALVPRVLGALPCHVHSVHHRPIGR